MTEAPSPLTPTSKHKLVYDAWNRLAKVSDASDNVIAEYRYNGVNHRTRKYVNQSGTWKITDYYYNSGWQVLEERNSSTTTSPSTAEPAVATVARAQYLWDIRYIDSPVCRWRDANGTGNGDGTLEDTIYYTTDANMNITALLNSNGSPISRLKYDAYGQPFVISGGSEKNEILYAGYRYDPETGLYHVRHRSYHPGLGRWNQRDPGPESPKNRPVKFVANTRLTDEYYDGMNLHQYVRSNPVGLMDPQGLSTPLPWPRPPASPSMNGCGSGSFDFVPDTDPFFRGFVNFRNACNKHDICYGTCGMLKEDCDLMLLIEMWRECDTVIHQMIGQVSWWQWPKYLRYTAACYAQAEIYYVTLTAAGGGPYKSAQAHCNSPKPPLPNPNNPGNGIPSKSCPGKP